jgi:hypothetical protein
MVDGLVVEHDGVVALKTLGIVMDATCVESDLLALPVAFAYTPGIVPGKSSVVQKMIIGEQHGKVDVRHMPFVDDTTFHVHQVHILAVIRRKEGVTRTALVRLMQEQTRLLLHDGAFLPMF